jgi:hypothetical protein
MKINKNLSREERRALENSGVIFSEKGQPSFSFKEVSSPKGMMRLPGTGRLIIRQSLEDILKCS